MWTPISDHGTLEKRLRGMHLCILRYMIVHISQFMYNTVEHSASPVVINTGTPTRIIDIVLIKNHKGT